MDSTAKTCQNDQRRSSPPVTTKGTGATCSICQYVEKQVQERQTLSDQSKMWNKLVAPRPPTEGRRQLTPVEPANMPAPIEAGREEKPNNASKSTGKIFHHKK